MSVADALLALVLGWSARYDEAMIRRAWKRKVKASHPDKNPRSSAQATAATQSLNEAKDTLLELRLDPLEYKRRAAEEGSLRRGRPTRSGSGPIWTRGERSGSALGTRTS